MADSTRTEWKRSVVKIWGPIAAVIAALKMLLFDLPDIYHKVTKNVSLPVIGEVLKYSGILMFLSIFATARHEKHQFALRLASVLLLVGFLWFDRKDPNSLEGAALVGWIIFICIGVSVWKERSRHGEN
jgi:hypothetical protein